jgi:hypothetical protein
MKARHIWCARGPHTYGYGLSVESAIFEARRAGGTGRRWQMIKIPYEGDYSVDGMGALYWEPHPAGIECEDPDCGKTKFWSSGRWVKNPRKKK